MNLIWKRRKYWVYRKKESSTGFFCF